LRTTNRPSVATTAEYSPNNFGRPATITSQQYRMLTVAMRAEPSVPPGRRPHYWIQVGTVGCRSSGYTKLLASMAGRGINDGSTGVATSSMQNVLRGHAHRTYSATAATRPHNARHAAVPASLQLSRRTGDGRTLWHTLVLTEQRANGGMHRDATPDCCLPRLRCSPLLPHPVSAMRPCQAAAGRLAVHQRVPAGCFDGVSGSLLRTSCAPPAACVGMHH
jgi:hypothetical protein